MPLMASHTVLVMTSAEKLAPGRSRTPPLPSLAARVYRRRAARGEPGRRRCLPLCEALPYTPCARTGPDPVSRCALSDDRGGHHERRHHHLPCGLGAARGGAGAGRRRARRERRAHRRRGPGARPHGRSSGCAGGRSRPLRDHARVRQLSQSYRIHVLPRHPRRLRVRRLDHQPRGREGRADRRGVPGKREARRPRAISSGITTIADTSYGAVTLEAAAEAGLRGRLYLEVFGVDDKLLDETMADVERRLAEAQAAAPPRFDVGLAPHAPYTVSSRLYQAISGLARERGLKVMSHVAESKEELTYIRSGSGKFAHDYREKMGWERMLVQPFGVSPIKYLQQWDVFDADFLAVHCVQVSRDDIRILKAKHVAVAHCPKSNAKLGCGVMPLADLLHEGVRVGLGSDSPASSNIMDMFDEMRTMLFLHRAVERDVTVLDAPKCVRIATLGGAEALGMQDDIGSLEPGKFADFIAVDVSKSHFAPIDEPYSALVYGANQDDVLLTVVGGDALFHERGYTGLDAEAIRRAAD